MAASQRCALVLCGPVDSEVLLDLIGKPFQWGGRGPEAYDCYGLVLEVYRRKGYKLPDFQSPEDRRRVLGLVDDAKPSFIEVSPEPGAIVLMNLEPYGAHVGLLLPYGRLIHASELTQRVQIDPVRFWEKRIENYYAYAGHPIS